MNNPLLIKLFACLPVGMAFIVSAIMLSASANAQIVYTDVNPDDTLNGFGTSTYALDLNDDSIADFNLVLSLTNSCRPNAHNYFSTVKSFNSNAVANRVTNVGTTVTNYPEPLSVNEEIDSDSSLWIADTIQTLFRSSYFRRGLSAPCSGPLKSGEWTDSASQYLGLKFSAGGNTFFGWVHLIIARNDSNVSHSKIIVKDYAYNSIPNQSILAGQTITTGIIGKEFASSIYLFPNPANNQLTIDLGSNNQKVEVTISDIKGKVIYTTTATQRLTVNTTDFAAGVYVVKFQSTDFIGTKRLMIAR